MPTNPALVRKVGKTGPQQMPNQVAGAPARPTAPIAPVTAARPQSPVRPSTKLKKPLKRPSLYAGGGSNDDGGDDNPNPVEPVPIF